MLRWLLVCVCLVSHHASSLNLPLQNNRCLVVYYLDGPAYAAFSLQVDAMQQQLIQQRIALIDLRHWRADKPHIGLSGRERRQLRQHLKLEHNVSQAVLVHHKNAEPQHFTGTVDLIDFLLACK